jgi:glycosyltransferase involved in cell wall biosynthesis
MPTVVIQVPCYNEEATLPVVLESLPKEISGFDAVKVLVIDDGSHDRTVEVARSRGAHVVCLGHHQGLAHAFRIGLEEALNLGASVIVNTDGDNQYQASYIPDLVHAVDPEACAMAVGVRDISNHPEFSWTKKQLHMIGSRIVSHLSGLAVNDVTSGFRAFTREAALKLCVVSTYSYTLETLIQAGHDNIDVVAVPIAVNPQMRKSRLARSIWHFVIRSGVTIVRIYAAYAALQIFFVLAAILGFIGCLGVGRFLYFYFLDPTQSGHIQSLVLSGVSMVLSLQMIVLGILSDQISLNRKLIHEVLYRLKRRDTPPPGLES